MTRTIGAIPKDRLASLAEYVEFLSRPSIKERLVEADGQLRNGKWSRDDGAR